jgi:hypothetical protein
VSEHSDPDAGKWGGMDALDKIAWMVEADGWALEAIPARPEVTPPNPAYAYSIGLPAAVEFPEIAVFGLTPVAAKGLVTLVADARRGGTEIPLGVELVGLLENELRCRFAPIELDTWGPLFDTATSWYSGSGFEVVQMLFPDRNGWMPYESGYDERLQLAHPVIGAL